MLTARRLARAAHDRGLGPREPEHRRAASRAAPTPSSRPRSRPGRMLGLSLISPIAGQLVEDLLEPVEGLEIVERDDHAGRARACARSRCRRTATSCSRSSATTWCTASTSARVHDPAEGRPHRRHPLRAVGGADVHAIVDHRARRSRGPAVAGGRPTRSPASGEVLVRVAASAVNRADLLQRQGLLPAAAEARPAYPGLECSGTVAALGDGVEGWSVGDAVHGAARAAAATPSSSPCPRGSSCRCRAGVDLVTAAALPEVACTVWSNVVMDARPARRRDAARARRRRRHRHLRDPGGRGARRARGRHRRQSPDKLARCRELGAEILVNYRDAGLRRRSCARPPAGTAPTSCSTTWARSTSRATSTCSPPSGRIAGDRLQGGTTGELDLGRLMSKRAQVRRHDAACAPDRGEGRDLRSASPPRRGRWSADGAIRPVVDRVLPDERRRRGAPRRGRQRARRQGRPGRLTRASGRARRSPSGAPATPTLGPWSTSLRSGLTPRPSPAHR